MTTFVCKDPDAAAEDYLQEAVERTECEANNGRRDVVWGGVVRAEDEEGEDNKSQILLR